jgi:hypothetical protein
MAEQSTLHNINYPIASLQCCKCVRLLMVRRNGFVFAVHDLFPVLVVLLHTAAVTSGAHLAWSSVHTLAKLSQLLHLSRSCKKRLRAGHMTLVLLLHAAAYAA